MSAGRVIHDGSTPKRGGALPVPPRPRSGGRKVIWTPRNIAALCDTIADGGSFADAAKRCKVSEMQARGRFRSIAKALGERADG